MKRTTLLLITILYSLASVSQSKKFVYYFDDKFNTVSKSNSSLTGTGTLEENLLSLRIVDNKTDQTVILAHYTHTSLAVNQGLFQSFFNNGKKASEGNYEIGKEMGVWKKWDESGRLTDSTMYDHGKKISNANFTYNKNGSINYKFEDLVNDKMQEVYYDDSGKVVTEAFFIGNSGIVKSYSKDGVKTDSVFSRESREASYPGGDAAWARYIRDKIKENISEIVKDNQSGTCRLRFIIDKEGKVTNVEALTMKGSALASVAKRALLNGPRWIPALRYGRPVNAYREQPVFFRIDN